MESTSKVIDLVVKNDLCIGCGLCTSQCTEKSLKMKWNDEGFLVPEQLGTCNCNGACISVCPFNPFPEEKIKTEDEISQIFLSDAQKYHSKIGHYNNIYAGYSKNYRQTSSSGGIATFVFETLLEKGIVNHIFSVQESTLPGKHYEYQVISSKKDLLLGSKTKYYPVTLATVLDKVNELDGKIAVVGVGCFIKAIRLAQYQKPYLKNKITFLVGIICGGVKSKFYSEYLAGKTGVSKDSIFKPEFRVKDLESSAADYSFSCFDAKTQNQHYLKMQPLGDMWGTGLFKANACDFCDDVTTELADISLGDAWMSPYREDGKGTNVVVTRTRTADFIIAEGLQRKKLVIDELSLKNFLFSQKGSFNHRQKAMNYRVKMAERKGKTIPPKRLKKSSDLTFYQKSVQILRMIIRKKSLILWREVSDSSRFDKGIQKFLKSLKIINAVHDKKNAITSRIRRLSQDVIKFKG